MILSLNSEERYISKMSSHVSKSMKKLLDKLRKLKFNIVEEGHVVKITPPKDIIAPMYIAHYGEKGYHPVRRYIKNKCKIHIK